MPKQRRSPYLRCVLLPPSRIHWNWLCMIPPSLRRHPRRLISGMRSSPREGRYRKQRIEDGITAFHQYHMEPLGLTEVPTITLISGTVALSLAYTVGRYMSGEERIHVCQLVYASTTPANKPCKTQGDPNHVNESMNGQSRFAYGSPIFGFEAEARPVTGWKELQQ